MDVPFLSCSRAEFRGPGQSAGSVCPLGLSSDESKATLLEKLWSPCPQGRVSLGSLSSHRSLLLVFFRMPDPDFTVRDVKLLVGELLAVRRDRGD